MFLSVCKKFGKISVCLESDVGTTDKNVRYEQLAVLVLGFNCTACQCNNNLCNVM
jgi:hypothetical protein